MKIIINSNINYKKAFEVLVDSLLKTKFDRFEDLVLVVSQAPTDAEPQKIPLNRILNTNVETPITVVGSANNNFDYTGYSMLNKYKDHELIASRSYLYLLDTVTFDTSFPERYKELSIGYDELLITEVPHSNICVFGRGIIDEYKTNFDVPLTKAEAVLLETRTWDLRKGNKVVKNITHFGNTVRMRNRKYAETKDIYELGYQRIGFFYEQLGLHKWILWNQNGDFTGNVVNNF